MAYKITPVTPLTRLYSLRDSRGIGPIASVAAIAAIGIVFLIIFLTTSTSTKIKTSTPPPAPPTPPPAADSSSANGQPLFIRIPEGYSVYTNKDYKFSFAFPTPWGPIGDSTTAIAAHVSYSTTFTDYQLGSSVLNGQLTAYVYPKDQFKILTHSNGAQVTAVKLGSSYGWKVVQTGSADPKLQVGNDYTVQTNTYQAKATIYDFSTIENGQIQGRWVFESGDNFIVVSLPVISRKNGTTPDGGDLATYRAIGNNLAKTMRPTN